MIRTSSGWTVIELQDDLRMVCLPNIFHHCFALTPSNLSQVSVHDHEQHFDISFADADDGGSTKANITSLLHARSRRGPQICTFK